MRIHELVEYIAKHRREYVAASGRFPNTMLIHYAMWEQIMDDEKARMFYMIGRITHNEFDNMRVILGDVNEPVVFWLPEVK